jgi:hypothetical protein
MPDVPPASAPSSALAELFERYEVVRQAKREEGKPARFTVYGFRADGLRVRLDQLYLADMTAELAQQAQEIAELKAEAARIEERDAALLPEDFHSYEEYIGWLKKKREAAEQTIARLTEHLKKPHYQGAPLMPGGRQRAKNIAMVSADWYRELLALQP